MADDETLGEFESFEHLTRQLLVVTKEDLDRQRAKDSDAPTTGVPRSAKDV